MSPSTPRFAAIGNFFFLFSFSVALTIALTDDTRTRENVDGDGDDDDDGMFPTTTQPIFQATPLAGNSDFDNLSQTMIYGTTVNVQNCKSKFKNFCETFFAPATAEMIYMDRIQQVWDTGNYNFLFDCSHLASVDRELYNQMLRYPGEVIPIFDMALEELLRESIVDIETQEIEKQIKFRPYNLLQSKSMRDLNPTDVDSLVSIRGMVTRGSYIIPDLKSAFFQCSKCKRTETVDIDRGFIKEPEKCLTCLEARTMSIVFNRCTFEDKQIVKLQETPDSIPEGETPQTVSLNTFGDLVDVARPGDRVTVTGIYRANPVRQNNVHRSIRSIFRTYIDVLHFEKEAKKEADGDDDFMTVFEGETTRRGEEMWDPEKVEKFKELASQPDVYERLTRSVAPSIWELDDTKKGILCQLFGGVTKILKDSKSRGDINILLCGDPGTSKSQILQYVHKLAPRGLYTSGKGSSAVGLTAYVTRDPDSGQPVLESGALVLSDRGICCLDEMDKMSDQTRSVLHEAMEQQSISIAKAGIICTLNARTSILASANPIESRYNPRLSVVENIQLPPTLLSRFDLIYLVLDQPSKVTDTRLARHLVKLYAKDPPVQDSIIDVDLLREYIAFARSTVFPRLTDEASQGKKKEGKPQKTKSISLFCLSHFSCLCFFFLFSQS